MRDRVQELVEAVQPASFLYSCENSRFASRKTTQADASYASQFEPIPSGLIKSRNWLVKHQDIFNCC